MRGFRIGVPGFSEKKICNKLLTDSDSLKQNSDWWGVTGRKKKLNIQQVTGLARILLIRNGIKNCTRKNSMWWSVGGGNTLEQTQRKLIRPSAPYVDFTAGLADYSTPRDVCRKISNKLYGIRHYSSNPPFIKTALNDIKVIVDPDSKSSGNKKKVKQQSNKLKFITASPGTQNVGSFFPHTRNFFQDAYISGTRLKKSKNTYIWREGQTTYSKEMSKLFEKKYRAFLKTRDTKDAEFPLPDDKEGRVIDFRNMYVVTKDKVKNTRKFGSQMERFKDNNRVIPRIKQIAQVDHQAVLFGEEESDKEEEVVGDDESFVRSIRHQPARREGTYQQRSIYSQQLPTTVHDDDDDDEEDDEDDYRGGDYYDDDDDDFDDYDSDEFHPDQEELQRMLMMNAALMNQNKGPQCPQQ